MAPNSSGSGWRERALRLRWLLGLSTAIALQLIAGPAAASAATVSVRFLSDPKAGVGADVAGFVAAPGESNVLDVRAVTEGEGMSWTFSDAGAPVHVGQGCVSLDSHTARCSSSDSIIDRATVELGDLGDSLSVTAGFVTFFFDQPFITADGGAGDDRLEGGVATFDHFRGGEGSDELFGSPAYGGSLLEGGPGNDLLIGGDDADVLDGGGGGDRLHAGGGNDILTDGDRDGATGDAAPQLDIIDGGPGRDEVSYRQRVRPLFVNLVGHPALGGERLEGDLLSGIESVTGGHGRDRLVGNEQRNVLDGLGGRDRLIGRGGNDVLRPGGDSFACGAGRDIVSRYSPIGTPPRKGDKEISARDFIPPSCEDIGYSADGTTQAKLPPYPPVARARFIGYRLGCPETEDGIIRCSGTVSVREAGGRRRLLAVGAFHYPLGRVEKARLTSLGRRLASRPSGVRAAVRITGLEFNQRRALSWSIQLKIPGSGPSRSPKGRSSPS